jgi:hypothetical protein
MPLLLQSHCPKPVQILGLGTGTWLCYAQTWQTSDSEMTIQAGLLYKVGTSGNTLKCCIISAALWLRVFTDRSVYFYISNSVGIISPRVCQRGFSPSAKLWEIRDLTGRPVITDVYLCGRIHAFCLSYFSNRPS